MVFEIGEICKLLKKCKECGVSRVVVTEDLVRFSFFSSKINDKMENSVETDSFTTEPIISEEELKEKEKKILADNEAKLKAEYMENLRLSDPYEYEKLLAQDELIPEKDEQNE